MLSNAPNRVTLFFFNVANMVKKKFTENTNISRLKQVANKHIKVHVPLTKKHILGSGCGSVGRAVTFDTRGPLFNSSHWQIFIEHLLVNLFIINCTEKTKMNKKRPGMALFKKNCVFVFSQRKNGPRIYLSCCSCFIHNFLFWFKHELTLNMQLSLYLLHWSTNIIFDVFDTYVDIVAPVLLMLSTHDVVSAATYDVVTDVSNDFVTNAKYVVVTDVPVVVLPDVSLDIGIASSNKEVKNLVPNVEDGHLYVLHVCPVFIQTE